MRIYTILSVTCKFECYIQIHIYIHSYIYISIYTCSPVKQKNTEFFQKKAKNRKIPKKNKNGTISSKSAKNQSRFKYFEK